MGNAPTERRRHGGKRSKGRRLCIYLPGFIVDRLEDYRKRQPITPAASRVIASALDGFLRSEERRKSRK